MNVLCPGTQRTGEKYKRFSKLRCGRRVVIGAKISIKK